MKADSSVQIPELKVQYLGESVEAGVINKRQDIVNDNEKCKHKKKTVLSKKDVNRTVLINEQTVIRFTNWEFVRLVFLAFLQESILLQ